MWQMSFFHTILLKSSILFLCRIKDGMWLRKNAREDDDDGDEEGKLNYLLQSVNISQSVKDKAGVRRLWMSKSQEISVFEWSPNMTYIADLWCNSVHLWITGNWRVWLVESRRTTTQACLLFLLNPSLYSFFSTFSLHRCLEYETWHGLIYGAMDHIRTFTFSREVKTRVRKTYNTWKVVRGRLFWHWHHFQARMKLEATVEAQRTMTRQS